MSEAILSEWNQALTAALAVIPGGSVADPQAIADLIRALMHDESPRGMAERNMGRTVKRDNQTGTIRGVRTDPKKKDRLCYVVAGAFGRVDWPVESVEVV
jgi:hypothetical protein